jgi:dipeptidyl aminopeptidase/acylaminoacyl peptidase
MTTLTPEMLADGLLPGDPQLAPDGRHVAYTVAPAGRSETGPQTALWLVAADGATPPRRLTAGVSDDTMPRWSPDGAWLYFLSDRAKRGETQVQRLSLAGGEAEALTDWQGGVSAFAPLADGHTLALLATDPLTDEDARRERERDDAIVWGERLRPRRLRLLDLGTRAIRTVEALGERHIAALAPAPAGTQLAVIHWPSPDIDNMAHPTPLALVDVASGAVSELATLPLVGQSIVWGGAGTALAYIAPAVAGGVSGNALYLFTLAEGTPRRLVADLPACPAALTCQGTGPILVTVADGLDTTVQRLDLVAGTLTELSRHAGELAAPTVSADGATIAAVRSTPDGPPNVWAGPVAGPLCRLTDLRPELAGIVWGAQERLAWTAADGLALDGLLILPPSKARADGPFPLIVLVHGGPYARFADDFQLASGRPSAQWLAQGGYAIFLPNERGGMGHGADFAYSVAGRVGLEDWDDILAGLDRLIAEGVADPGRLGIGGWSQGGFMTAWAVGQDAEGASPRFRCGVMGAGVSDWGMMVAESDLPTFEAGLGGSTGWEGIGPHQHDRVSPISFIHRVKTPVLLLHGERDERVPVGQAQFFARGLRRYGVPNELVIYPREPHGLRERAHQIDATRRQRAWFDRWLANDERG